MLSSFQLDNSLMDSSSKAKNEGNGQLFSSSSVSLSPASPREANMQERRSLAAAATPTFMGKHRMSAAITYLEQQIQIVQEELEQLETLGESSIVCKELIASVESAPDALVPETRGPLSSDWDRWFQGGHSSRSRKRWI